MPRKTEPKLTKKQLRELAKQKKLEEERRIREEQERIVAEEKRKREEELEPIRQAELKYRQEEAFRLKSEEEEYLSFFIAFMHNKDRVSKGFKENLEWKRYVDCQEIYKVERQSDINMMTTLLKEKRITDEKSLNCMLDMIDQALEFVVKINVKIMELVASGSQDSVQSYIESRRLVFKTVRQKLKQVHCFVLQIAENLVEKKLADLRKNQTEVTSKPGKGSDLKPEVQLGYKRSNFAVGYWIMAFENSGIKPTPINFKELNAMSDVPKAFFSKKLAMFAVKFNSNFLDVHKIGGTKNYESKFKNHGQFLLNPYTTFPLNGFLEVGCLDLLSESKKIGDFEIKRLLNVNESLKRLAIPTVEGTNSNFKVYTFPDALTTLEEASPLDVFYYDRAKKIWTKENVASVKTDYNEELKKDEIVASVPIMAPYVLTEPLANHLPFQGLKIRRMENGNVKVSLETVKSEMKFEVGQGYVKLTHSSSENLTQVFNVEMRPHELLFKLAECGLLLVPHLIHHINGAHKIELPEDFDEISTNSQKPPTEELPTDNSPTEEGQPESTQEPQLLEETNQPTQKTYFRSLRQLVEGFKKPEVEEYCRNEVTRHSLRFAIRLSKWNADAGPEHVVLKIRENSLTETNQSTAQAGSWKTVLMSRNKCEILALDDNAKQFSIERKEGTVSHLNLFLLVKQYPQLFNYYTYSDEFTNSDLLAIETLEMFLRPMQMFAFSS
jgi:hypothetical protein